MAADGFKTCPRCDGKKWTYYVSHRCTACRGTGRVHLGLHRCEGISAPVYPYGHPVPRQCWNVTTKRFEGKWVCWVHNPQGGFAGYRRMVEAHRAEKKYALPRTRATVAWRRQRARMKAAVEGRNP